MQGGQRSFAQVQVDCRGRPILCALGEAEAGGGSCPLLVVTAEEVICCKVM
jgi:hypothetical protein